MKTLINLSLVVWCAAFAQAQASLTQPPPTPPSVSTCTVAADDQAIRGIPEHWKDGYNAGDAAEVAALYADDAYYLTQHFATGIIHGRHDIQAYVQHGIDARYRIDAIELLATICSGDIAYAITRYRSTNAGQQAVGVNLVVLRKVGNHWLIVAHEATVPDPATAIHSLSSDSH
jgi:uncharacterized protein (TIGR02246 family)